MSNEGKPAPFYRTGDEMNMDLTKLALDVHKRSRELSEFIDFLPKLVRKAIDHPDRKSNVGTCEDEYVDQQCRALLGISQNIYQAGNSASHILEALGSLGYLFESAQRRTMGIQDLLLEKDKYSFYLKMCFLVAGMVNLFATIGGLAICVALKLNPWWAGAVFALTTPLWVHAGLALFRCRHRKS